MPLDTAQLWELASLREQGVLTEAEFQAEKSKVLSQVWIRTDGSAQQTAMALDVSSGATAAGLRSAI